MSTRPLSLMSSAAVAALLVTLAPGARAQEAPPAQAAPVQAQPQPQYTAPIYQQTQPTYVPQSVAMSGPREIRDWEDGDPIPPGYHRVERVRKGLIIGGAVTFGTLWLISVLVAAAGSDASGGGSNPVGAMYIPVAGPFVQMAKTESATANVFLAIDGIAQAAGATMFIVGLTSPRTTLVRNDLAENTKPKLTIAPIVSRGTTGMGLVGSF